LLYFREDRPWSELRYGKGIDRNWVARTLKDYKITPEQIRPADGRRVRGYRRIKFEDAFARYLPPDQEQASSEGATPQEVRDSSADQVPHYLQGPRRQVGAAAVAGM
jgi:hypothetical protein